MDCHRCRHIRYDGCSYGRCSLPCHPDVRLVRPGSKGRKSDSRPYNMQKCPDFSLMRRCSNCRYWKRGEYFSDGRTPARKGRCSLDLSFSADSCPMWKKGKTSWRKQGRSGKEHE